jgi:menaquinone-dependent protoporphyrinogen IX oxidase
MKVAIIYSPKHQKLEAVAKVLGQTLQKDGHLVDYVHVGKSDRPVSIRRYDFVYLGSVAEGTFGGKVPVEVSEFVKQCRGFEHVKSAAFMLKRILFNAKGLRRLMAVLESVGSVVVDFQIVGHTSDAELLAKRLKMAV